MKQIEILRLGIFIYNIYLMSQFQNNPQLVSQKVEQDCHPVVQPKDHKIDSQQMNYYNQFCRLYLTNTILTAQLKELNFKLSRIQKRAEEFSQGNSGQGDQKKRRVRRSASEIARHYKCQVEGCNKSYGSEGSLNQHLKIKHMEVFRTLGAYSLSNNPPVKESGEEDDSSL